MNRDEPERANRRVSWRKGFLGFVGVFVLGVFGFFFGMIAADPGDVFAMIEAGVGPGQSGSRVVTGTVRNRSDSLYSDIQFEIQLLDGDGVVGKTFARERYWWW
jgi:hypothetical protein